MGSSGKPSCEANMAKDASSVKSHWKMAERSLQTPGVCERTLFNLCILIDCGREMVSMRLAPGRTQSRQLDTRRAGR